MTSKLSFPELPRNGQPSFASEAIFSFVVADRRFGLKADLRLLQHQRLPWPQTDQDHHNPDQPVQRAQLPFCRSSRLRGLRVTGGARRIRPSSLRVPTLVAVSILWRQEFPGPLGALGVLVLVLGALCVSGLLEPLDGVSCCGRGSEIGRAHV